MVERMEYAILQPTSTERVLSGICYHPQWLYAAMKEKGYKVRLFEDMSMTEIDLVLTSMVRRINKLEPHEVVINLSSYPQKDMCQQVWREYKDRLDITFAGYTPLIKALGLPVHRMTVDIMDGVSAYHKYIDGFLKRTVTDYDSHLVRLDDGKPYMPLFLSVGCKRKCPYCYVGYSDFPHGNVDLDVAIEAIDSYAAKGWNIHFYDEDLFNYPQIGEVLKHLRSMPVKWICLTTSVSLAKAREEYGEDAILRSGNVLNEIGVETADEKVLVKSQRLKDIIDSELSVFWLTVTFFPSETLESKYLTGQFLQRYGHDYDQLVPRIRTNSSPGGLGQFFQPYHGTPWYDGINDEGVVLDKSPTRLWPSFVGYRFLEEVPQRQSCQADGRWLTMYGAKSDSLRLWAECTGDRTVLELCGSDTTKLAQLAQLAQLGMVR